MKLFLFALCMLMVVVSVWSKPAIQSPVAKLAHQAVMEKKSVSKDMKMPNPNFLKEAQAVVTDHKLDIKSQRDALVSSLSDLDRKAKLIRKQGGEPSEQHLKMITDAKADLRSLTFQTKAEMGQVHSTRKERLLQDNDAAALGRTPVVNARPNPQNDRNSRVEKVMGHNVKAHKTLDHEVLEKSTLPAVHMRRQKFGMLNARATKDFELESLGSCFYNSDCPDCMSCVDMMGIPSCMPTEDCTNGTVSGSGFYPPFAPMSTHCRSICSSNPPVDPMCSTHAECGDCSYCDTASMCHPIEFCNEFSAIDAICPAVDPNICGSSNPPVDPMCSTHAECGDCSYCDTASMCHPIEFCNEFSAIDAICPAVDPNICGTSSPWYPYYYEECQSHDACGECNACMTYTTTYFNATTSSYVDDSFNYCLPASYCGQFEGEVPVDGNCPPVDEAICGYTWYDHHGGCNSTEQCGDCDYCDIYGSCWNSFSCSMFNDAVEGFCPPTDEALCDNPYESWSPWSPSSSWPSDPWDSSWSYDPWNFTMCNSHDECGEDSYCDRYGYCYGCCSCPYFNDSVTGECPDCMAGACDNYDSSFWDWEDYYSWYYWFPSQSESWSSWWSSSEYSCWWCSELYWSDWYYSYSYSDYWIWSDYSYEQWNTCVNEYYENLETESCSWDYWSSYSWISDYDDQLGVVEGCVEHANCDPTQYCDTFSQCWDNCCDCHLFGDAINGVCPQCMQECETSYPSFFNYTWSDEGCQRHADCHEDAYCDVWGACYPRCECDYFDDSFDGECPPTGHLECKLLDFYNMSDSSSSGWLSSDWTTCANSRDCGANEYCWLPLEWNPTGDGSSWSTYSVTFMNVSSDYDAGFCDSCCYCQYYVDDLNYWGVEHDVSCPTECNGDCGWIDNYNTCNFHSDCADGQYCTEWNYCDASCYCPLFGDSIEEECPDTCEDSCTTNDDCNEGLYCTSAGVCQDCCSCTYTEEWVNNAADYYSSGSYWQEWWINDPWYPISGECSCDCGWEDYSSSWWVYDDYSDFSWQQCEAHSDCGDNHYCDTWGNCFEGCSCEWYQDAVDGTCPEVDYECQTYDYNSYFGFDMDYFCNDECWADIMSAEITYYECLGYDEWAREYELYTSYMCVQDSTEEYYCMNQIEELVYSLNVNWYYNLASFDFSDWSVDGSECLWLTEINCCGPTMVDIFEELVELNGDPYLEMNADFLRNALEFCGLADQPLCVLANEVATFVEISYDVLCLDSVYFSECYKSSECAAAVDALIASDISVASDIPAEFISVQSVDSNGDGSIINIVVRGTTDEETAVFAEQLVEDLSFDALNDYIGLDGLILDCGADVDTDAFVIEVELCDLKEEHILYYEETAIVAAAVELLGSAGITVNLAGMKDTTLGVKLTITVSVEDQQKVVNIAQVLATSGFGGDLASTINTLAQSYGIAFHVDDTCIDVSDFSVPVLTVNAGATIKQETVVQGAVVEVKTDAATSVSDPSDPNDTSIFPSDGIDSSSPDDPGYNTDSGTSDTSIPSDTVIDISSPSDDSSDDPYYESSASSVVVGFGSLLVMALVMIAF